MKRYFLLYFFLGCFLHLYAQCPTSGNTVTVTTTASSGVGSLADAINCANTRPAVVNIVFDIPGPALKIIQPTSALPTLSKAGATIDGNTQGSTVILDGTLLSTSGSGLTLSGNNITVQGLYIRNFNAPSGNGINVLSGNGTDISGNTIAGNRNGITINTAAPVFTISGNTIGENTGGGALANTQHGINVLGNPTSGVISNNTIANSGAVGINAGNGNLLITDNSIYCNVSNGIVRGSTAPVAPVITRANTQQIRGTAASGRVIEVFSHSTTGCTNAPCQGRTLLGIVTAPANGVWILDLSAGQVAGGARVTATSTQNGNNTSIFSACATVTNCATLNVNTTVGNVTCNGANNGSATATASGGSPVAAYTYVWSNGATGSNITGLAPGTYTVTVTDAAGCTDSATASVSQPSALDLFINTQNATCTGASTGSAVAVPSGGSPPYIAYRWSTGQTTVSINNIPAGTYTVTVTDRQGCTISQNASVGQPMALGLVLVPQNAACFGGSTGSVTASANGGTPTYSYVWGNGQTGPTATNLAAGTYTATATDAQGCTIVQNGTVGEPPVLMLALSSTPETAFNANNGTAMAMAEGGVGGYTYLWSNGQATPTIFNLAPGVYTCTVRDANNCIQTASITVNAFVCAGLSVTLNASDVTCNGFANGNVVASPSGSSGYTYLWSNGAATVSIGNLSPGTYTCTITDAAGCTAVASASIAQPLALSLLLTPQNIACFGQATGAISSNTNGGTPPYNYIWSNGQTTSNLTNLPVGTYSLTITDQAACTLVRNSTVGGPPQLTLALSNTPETAANANNGTATASPAGGTPSYNYIWSNGQTTIQITSLSPGTYTCTVRDANNCTQTGTTTVGAFGCNVGLALNAVNVTCNSLANGSITAVPSGGNGHTYVWNTGATSATVNNLAPGTYTCTVRDANNCTAVQTASVTQPPILSVNLSNTPETAANANNGTATASPGGGTPSYNYIWNNGQTTAQIANLAPGAYTCTVRDANNCTQTATTTVGAFGCNVGLALNAVNVTCNSLANGSITAVPNGGNGHTYVWNTGATSATVNNLAPGTYTCTVRDANNCTAVQTASVTQPPVLSVNLSNTPETAANANDGTATASPAGGTPSYNYIWSNGQTTIQITSLGAGTYTCTVRDANNCTQTGTTTVGAFGCNVGLALNAVNVTCNGLANGSITAVPSGGNGHTYVWNTGATSATVNNLAPGTYTCTVRDANNCTAVQTASVTQPPILSVNLVKTNETTANAKDGTATASPAGGIAPYQYFWNSGQTVNRITNLSPGTYTCTVRDANNCTAVAAVSVLSGGSAACVTRPVYAVLVPSEVCGNEPFTLEIDELYPNALLRYVVYLPNGDSLFITQTKVDITPTSTAFSGEYFVVRDSLGCRSKAVGGAPVRVVSFAKGALWAGRDTLLCTAVPITLRGNAPLNQSGTWVSLGKATVESPGTAQTTVRGLVPGPNLFVWKVALPACPNAGADTVQVFLETPPRLGDDRYTLSRASDVAVMEVLLNDQLIGLPDTLVRQIGTPETGTLEYLAAEKRFRYTVDEDFRGTVKFHYAVCVETASPCGFECDTALVTIAVLNLPKVPEGLVVEDPGPNGELKIKGANGFEQLELHIFNRWGDLVYFSKAYSNDTPWRGDFNGKNLPQGAYYYHLKAFEKDNKQVGDVQKGVIYLVERE